MNHAQKYLAQANRQIAELRVQIAGQRVVVKHALDTGQRLEMAESLLDALEGSVRIFEKHRMFLLSRSESFSALPPGAAAIRPEPVMQRAWSVMTKTNAGKARTIQAK